MRDTSPDPKIVATTRAALLAHAREHAVLHDHVLQRYAQHGLLARLAATDNSLCLTGGMALAARLGVDHRRLLAVEVMTPDADLIGRLPVVGRDLAGTGSDGLTIDAESIRVRPLDRGDAPARRVVATASINTATAPVRLDVELAEPDTPVDTLEVDPRLPGAESVSVPVVSMDAIFSEAVEQLVRRGALRARMVDLYDAWLASQADPLDGLDDAVDVAFQRRGTPVPDKPPHVLTERWAGGRHTAEQWGDFAQRYKPTSAVGVAEAVAGVRQTMYPDLPI